VIISCPQAPGDTFVEAHPRRDGVWTTEDRVAGRVPAGLWARIVQRLLALNAAIWHNWQIGAPVKRSLIAYDH
jgi:hypothetical protein